jgi:hypothetical protein
MPGDGASMLRRLFPSPVIIVSYSLDTRPIRERRESGSPTVGRRCVLKMQKPVPSTYNLRIPAGDCILFPVSGAQVKFFRAKTRPENAVGMPGTEVGALFRFTDSQRYGLQRGIRFILGRRNCLPNSTMKVSLKSVPATFHLLHMPRNFPGRKSNKLI